MKFPNILLLISFSLLSAALSGHAAERAALVAGPEMALSSTGGVLTYEGDWIALCREGNGLWDVTVKRGQDGQPYEFPLGVTVDNTGYVYVCDTPGRCILVFTADGKPYKRFTQEDLGAPLAVEPIGNGRLLVTTAMRGKTIQRELVREGEEWKFNRLDPVEVVAGDGAVYSGEVSPFGKNGLRYVRSTNDASQQLVLVDEQNRYVKSVPCHFFDKEGQYYRSLIDEPDLIGVFDESGKLLGKFVVPGTGRLKFRGWIYFYDFSNEEAPVLRRYGADGSIEDEIALVDYEVGQVILISPNQERILALESGFVKEEPGSGTTYRIRIRRYIHRQGE